MVASCVRVRFFTCRRYVSLSHKSHNIQCHVLGLVTAVHGWLQDSPNIHQLRFWVSACHVIVMLHV